MPILISDCERTLKHVLGFPKCISGLNVYKVGCYSFVKGTLRMEAAVEGTRRDGF